ncbi:MAG: hypothetical protein Q9193_005568 [Seirophora villosa]
MFTLGTRGEFAGRALSPGVMRELSARTFAWHPIPEHLIWSGPPPQPVHEPEPEGSSTPRTQHTRRGRPSKSKQHRDEPSALDPSDTATSKRQRRPRKSNTLQNPTKDKPHRLKRELKALGISYSPEAAKPIKQRLRNAQAKHASSSVRQQSDSGSKNKRRVKGDKTSARVKKRS